MKKLILGLIMIFVCSTVWGAGSTSSITDRVDFHVEGNHMRRVLTISFTADDTNGTIPDLTINATTYELQGWYLYTVETNPGSTAPTDNWDAVINDTDSVDIAGGLLLNRDTTTSELVNIGASAHGYPVVRGNLTVVISGNSVNSATGVITLIFVAN